MIRLYERPECHLCDQAMKQLLSLRAEGLVFAIERVDIESDESLLRRFLERIPVIELDGRIVDELGLDTDGLRRRLATVSA